MQDRQLRQINTRRLKAVGQVSKQKKSRERKEKGTVMQFVEGLEKTGREMLREKGEDCAQKTCRVNRGRASRPVGVLKEEGTRGGWM